MPGNLVAMEREPGKQGWSLLGEFRREQSVTRLAFPGEAGS